MSLGMWDTITVDQRTVRMPWFNLLLFTDGMTVIAILRRFIWSRAHQRDTWRLAGLPAQQVAIISGGAQAFQNGQPRMMM
jgi:hypothetical protein